MVKALRFIFSVRPSKSSLARYKRGDETWALVTGGSDGMASLPSRLVWVITMTGHRLRPRIRACVSRLQCDFAEAQQAETRNRES
jgi:hypothetical protein